MKYTNSEQWYQEYGKEVMDKDEFSEFKKYLNDRSKDGSHPLDEQEDLYADFLKDSKKSARKSIKEAFDDDITVKEFCFWGHSGNMVEIWTIDGILCDAFEVRNVGKSEYKNYEIHGWDCAKNTVIIYIKK